MKEDNAIIGAIFPKLLLNLFIKKKNKMANTLRFRKQTISINNSEFSTAKLSTEPEFENKYPNLITSATSKAGHNPGLSILPILLPRLNKIPL